MVRKHALLLLFLLAACSSKSIAPDTPAQVDPREQELCTVIAEAEPVVSNLLTALNAGDYAAYSRDFDTYLRDAITAEKLAALQEQFAKTIGVYEAGMFQVNKIEAYPGWYRIYYFVKFSGVQASDPVIMTVKVVKTQTGLQVSDLTYSHALLGR